MLILLDLDLNLNTDPDLNLEQELAVHYGIPYGSIEILSPLAPTFKCGISELPKRINLHMQK